MKSLTVLLCCFASIVVPATARGQAFSKASTQKRAVGPMISGAVLDPEGKPASGVELLLTDASVPLDRGRARTDDLGKFRVELRGQPIDKADRVVLWAYRPGSLAASKEVDRKALASGDPIEIRLQKPSKAEFLVTDLDGTPIPHAKVAATRLTRDDLAVPEVLQDLTAAETDAKGLAEIAAFRPEEIQLFDVTAADYGRQRWKTAALGSAEGPKLIRLLPVGGVHGTVLDKSGKGVGGLKLVVMSTVEFIDMDRYTGPPVGFNEVTTDASGRFEVAAIPEGKLAISIQPTKNRVDDVSVPLGDERIWASKTSTLTIQVEKKSAAETK